MLSRVKSKLNTFLGGVHPKEYGKKLTSDKHEISALVPQKVYLFMDQNIGSPAKPVVRKGDIVKKGQFIGESQGFISSNVHASICGKVADVKLCTHPITGKKSLAVIIENSGEEDEWEENTNIEQDISSISPEEIRKRVFSAGIVGLGGAAFPSHVKLSPPKDKTIDTVVLNGAECEPYLTCDHQIMRDKSREIIHGLRLAMKAIGCNNAYIGIESNKKDVYDKFKYTLSDDPSIKIVLVEVKYPQGAEHPLVKALLNREFQPTQLPLEVGAVVFNVATAFSIYEAVRFNRPLIQRVVTITGNGVKYPQNFLVRIGTPVKDLLEKAGMVTEINKIIFGGPMMGVAVGNIETAVTVKSVGGILVLKDAKHWEPHACIRCGRCITSCPYGLNPSELSTMGESQEFILALENNVLECKECGCCSYICPAKRPIVHQIRFTKAEINRQKLTV